MPNSEITKSCPMCGGTVMPEEHTCPACGERFREQQPLTDSERYILRKFQNQMSMLSLLWYALGVILTAPSVLILLAAIRYGQFPVVGMVRDSMWELLLWVGSTAFGILFLVVGWGCRHRPQWSLRASLVIGYSALACNLLLLVLFVNVCGFLAVIPVLLLSHIALWTAQQVRAEGIALDDKR